MFSCVQNITFIFYGLSSIIRQILYTRNTHKAYNFYLKLLSNSAISFYPAHMLQKNHIPGITLSYNPVPPRTRFPFRPVRYGRIRRGTDYHREAERPEMPP